MTPPCVVPTFRPYAAENLEFGGFYASSCESRASDERAVGVQQGQQEIEGARAELDGNAVGEQLSPA